MTENKDGGDEENAKKEDEEGVSETHIAIFN
jgi:hypothetical protein